MSVIRRHVDITRKSKRMMLVCVIVGPLSIVYPDWPSLILAFRSFTWRRTLLLPTEIYLCGLVQC